MKRIESLHVGKALFAVIRRRKNAYSEVSWATMKAFLEQKGLDQTGTLTLLMEVAEVLRRSARVVADADAPERPGNQGQGNGERDGAKQIR